MKILYFAMILFTAFSLNAANPYWSPKVKDLQGKDLGIFVPHQKQVIWIHMEEPDLFDKAYAYLTGQVVKGVKLMKWVKTTWKAEEIGCLPENQKGANAYFINKADQKCYLKLTDEKKEDINPMSK
jgi:hypothetical protein